MLSLDGVNRLDFGEAISNLALVFYTMTVLASSPKASLHSM